MTTPYETFGGETVYSIRESAEDQIRRKMTEEGFTDDIPTINGVYHIVFYVPCGREIDPEEYNMGHLTCDKHYRWTTAGYTVPRSDGKLTMHFASHTNPNPRFVLDEIEVGKMREFWNTKAIWFKLIEEIIK